MADGGGRFHQRGGDCAAMAVMDDNAPEETLIKSVRGACRRFSAASALQNLENHKGFLRFCVLMRRKIAMQARLGPIALAGFNQRFLDVYVTGLRECRSYLYAFRAEIQDILSDMNLKPREVICVTENGQTEEIPYEDVMQQYYDKRETIYIPGIHKYVNPAELLQDTYYNWEQEAARYRLRMDEEKTRAETALIDSENKKTMRKGWQSL